MRVKQTLEQVHARMGETIVVSYIYGGMPFEVREAQAKRFNDGVEAFVRQQGRPGGGHAVPKHVLVATDAIAFGLNMNIERVVLHHAPQVCLSATRPGPRCSRICRRRAADPPAGEHSANQRSRGPLWACAAARGRPLHHAPRPCA
ncbi:hypothetical protein STCU_11693 [Strigomonas culicis]|uniref:Helicase C-terminal domain-containing protein n=1 Tax=Strigomonas culicis TaxID=28005 RepID=S9UMF3_9TRYP|nr:hypothetical protein STCU_11693 [Strigomonas culicis]|eukprot:EPY15891.1 hypothetical protein STCU_11693 [Strigomonas culicis]